MKTHHLLRISSALMFLFAAGHSAGGLKSWSPAGDTAVLQAMRTVSFTAGRATRTYLNFYEGFGWILSVFLLLQAVLLWQLASIAKTNPGVTRGMIASFFVATVAAGVISWKLILPPPTIFSAVITATLAAAFLTAGRHDKSATSTAGP